MRSIFIASIAAASVLLANGVAAEGLSHAKRPLIAEKLREAMADKPVAQAAKAVAKRFGLDRHDIYARALALKEQA